MRNKEEEMVEGGERRKSEVKPRGSPAPFGVNVRHNDGK